MPKMINAQGKTKPIAAKIPVDLYDSLAADGVENERSMTETIRWALKWYIKNKEQQARFPGPTWAYRAARTTDDLPTPITYHKPGGTIDDLPVVTEKTPE